jgi:MFS family permease
MTGTHSGARQPAAHPEEGGRDPVDGPAPVGPGSRFAVFRVPGFAPTYAVGVVWSMCRWGLGFLGAYVVKDLTGSPRLVQLTGAMLWAPLLLAGMVGGTISDRFPRRTVLLTQFAVLCPLTAGVGLLALSDNLALPVLYAYMVIAGFGWVIDMTVRRAMVHDIVGDEHLNRAMAFEGLSSSLGLAAGAMAGGALIELGTGQAYLVVAGAMVVAAALVTRVPASALSMTVTAPVPGPSGGRASFTAEVAEGLRSLGSTPLLLSILGVTALTNFFHFAYFPIVPVIAERVGADGFMAGLLAAATGFGMAMGSTFVLARRPHRGVAYVVGASGAFLLLNGFALFDRYLFVYLSLLAASAFVGVFGATQSVLVMTAADPAMRGRALGMLSMAIGCLPLGMYGLGELAEVVGAPAAVVTANVVGLGCLWAFLAWRPQVLRLP